MNNKLFNIGVGDISVCVYGASSNAISECYITAAHELGRLIALHGWHCVNGGGKGGLMRAASDGALSQGGKVIGVLPLFMIDNGWNYSALSSTISTCDMHERKSTMAQLASAFVAMPGGSGTLEELSEILTWLQLGLVKAKPLVLLNTCDYYKHLIAHLDHSVSQGFMRASHRALIAEAQTPQEAIEIIATHLTRGDNPIVESKY